MSDPMLPPPDRQAEDAAASLPPWSQHLDAEPDAPVSESADSSSPNPGSAASEVAASDSAELGSASGVGDGQAAAEPAVADSIASSAETDWGGSLSLPSLEPQDLPSASNPAQPGLTQPGLAQPAPAGAPSAETDFFNQPPYQPAEAKSAAATAERNLKLAIPTAAALIGVAWLAFALGEKVTLALVTILLLAGVVEFYAVLSQVKYRPAALLGYVTTVGLSVGVFWQGSDAYPVVLGLAFVLAMMWHLFGVGERLMLPDLSATFLGIMYVGVLGSFAALLLTFEHGVYLVVGCVIVSVGSDLGAWAVGRLMGRTLLTTISPGKTVEGLVGGFVIAFVAVLVLPSVFDWKPWVDPGSFDDRIVFAVAACVMAPIGDLAQSLIKRNLEVKDMGFLLPGHGGILDRFDSLLFVLPTCYFVVRLTGLAALA